MEVFLQSYGLWILLAAVFLAMHWFGRSGGEGREPGQQRQDQLARLRQERRPEATQSGRGCH